MQTVTIEETYKSRGVEKKMTSVVTTARLGNGTESHIAVIEYGEARIVCQNGTRNLRVTPHDRIQKVTCEDCAGHQWIPQINPAA